MRKDMAKVLVEDGRIGGGEGARKRKRQHRRRSKNQFERNPEGAPKRESMSGRRNYGWDCKQLNEFLNPLQRFLESRAGQPWSKVYAEIRENLNPNNVVQNHIMQHLWDYVDREVKISDQGVPVRPNRYIRSRGMKDNFTVNGRGGWAEATGYGSWSRFYIHPESDLLLKLPERTYRRPRKEAKTHHREGRRLFRKYDGIWYELEVRPLPAGWVWGGEPRWTVDSIRREGYEWQNRRIVRYGQRDYGPEDAWFGAKPGNVIRKGRRGFSSIPSVREVKLVYGRLDVYAPKGAKRQVGSRELRRLGLKNG